MRTKLLNSHIQQAGQVLSNTMSMDAQEIQRLNEGSGTVYVLQMKSCKSRVLSRTLL
jgi:hypothetical protein